MKKEKPGQTPGQRHSSAANYEINPQSAMLHDHSDEYVLELFEQMLVSKTVTFVFCVWESDTENPLFIISPGQPNLFLVYSTHKS